MNGNGRGGRRRPDFRTRGRMRDCFFLLRDRPQHIAGARDVREIDLGLDLVAVADRAGSSRGCARFFPMST
jgi:hypothetical protein